MNQIKSNDYDYDYDYDYDLDLDFDYDYDFIKDTTFHCFDLFRLASRSIHDLNNL
jgi:hypothetical protein